MAKTVSKEQAGSVQQPRVPWRCTQCGIDFEGAKNKPKCPTCGNEVSLVELNSDGLPINVLNRALDRSPPDPRVAAVLKDYDLLGALEQGDTFKRELWDRTLTDELQEDTLERIKKKKVESKAERLEAEKRLKAIEAENEGAAAGGVAGMKGPVVSQPSPQMSSYILEQILKLDEGDREWWLEKLKDPSVSMSIASLMNPNVQIQAYHPYQQQMMLQNLLQRPKTEESSGGGAPNAGMMMSDMAAAVGEIFKTVKEMMPAPQPASPGVPSELKEMLDGLKRNYEGLQEKYYLLQLEQVKAAQGAMAGVNPAGGRVLTKEDLEEIVDRKLAAAHKSPVETIKEVKNLVVELDQFRDGMAGKLPEQQESFDDWAKKQAILQAGEKQKKEMELELKRQEREAAKYGAVKSLIQGGFTSALAKVAKENQEAKEESGEREKGRTPSRARRDSAVTLVR